MGYWKNVSYEISRGVDRATAEKLVATEMYGKTKEERERASAQLESEVKLNKIT